jgi:glycosyltransferase involved in cell wall biosynthesis
VKKKIKVAFIQAGYSNYDLPLCEKLQDKYHVYFYSLKQVNFSSECSIINKPLYYIYDLDEKKTSSNSWFPLQKKLLVLFSSLIRNKYNINVTSCISPHTVVSVIASKIVRNKIIIFIEEWATYKPKSIRSIIKISSLNLISKYILKNANAIVVEGSPQRSYVQSYRVPDEKIFQANLSSFDYSNFKSESLRQKLNIGDAFVILYFARIVKNKGLDILIQAFSRIQQERGDVYLLIGGDGDFRDSCEKAVKQMKIKNVIFAGSIFDNEAKASFYKTGDLLVYPSRIIVNKEIAEGWGLAINEAMSMGKPVISTDAVGASEDLVRNGFNGYIIKNGEIEELYIALRNIIENPELKKTMGENSRIIFEEFNDYRKMFMGFDEAIKYSLSTGRQAN